MQLHHLVCSFILLLANSVHGQQLEIYTTIDDLLKGTPRLVNGYHFDDYKGEANTTLIFQSNTDKKERIEIVCSEIWGFKYDSSYYRIVKPGPYYEEKRAHNFPILLMAAGKIYYYQNALAHLRAENKRGKSTEYIPPVNNYCAFMSATLSDGLVRIPCYTSTAAWAKKEWEAFFARYPEYDSIKECASHYRNIDYDMMNSCVRNYLQSTKE